MSKRTPAAPDYTGAAREQAEASERIANQGTWADRPNIQTPWGSQTWNATAGVDPSTGRPITQWDMGINLTPEAQAALDSQMRVQQGLSNTAEGMLGRVSQETANPMDWSGFQQLGAGANVPQYGQGLSPFGQSPQGGLMSFGQMPGQGLPQFQGVGQGLFGFGQLPDGFNATAGPNQQQYSPEQIQRGVDTAGPDLNPAERYRQDANDAIFNQWADRALPQQERDTDRIRTQLYNQGLREGDVAFDREMDRLRESQGDALRQAQYQATIGSGQEAQRMLGMDQGVRGQLFGENVTQGQFANQASQQALMQQLGIGGQQFNEQMAGAQFGAGQEAQRFNQLSNLANMQNQMRGQQFGEQMAGAQLTDAQRAQMFGEQATQANLQNQMRGQQFGENLAGAQFANDLRRQQGNEQLQFGNQQFNQQMAQSNYQNMLRQQQIAEAMQQRGFSLNELNALMYGQQVATPQMPGFNSSSQAQAPQLLAAAGMQGQSQLDAFNAQQGALQGMMGGAASLGMMFSDRRLKRNIQKLGVWRGVQWYIYEYIWGGTAIGVMADEVPHAAVLHPSGYLMVDYGRV